MRFLKQHYDKLILLLSVVVCACFGLLEFFFHNGYHAPHSSRTQAASTFDVEISDWQKSLREKLKEKYDLDKDGKLGPDERKDISSEDQQKMKDAGLNLDLHYKVAEIETRNPHGLMPGDQIEFLDNTGESKPENRFFVHEIVFPDEYDEVLIQPRSGDEITGSFRTAERLTPTKVTKVLAFSRDANLEELEITIEKDGFEYKIYGNEIESFDGSRKFRVLLDGNATSYNFLDNNASLIVYQRHNHEQTANTDVTWEGPTDSAKVSYDLFTPPIIYMFKGANGVLRLADKPPEPPKEIKPPEPFGLQLVSFENKPYHFNLKSWGADPLLFDERNQRSRIVTVGQCYKDGKHWIEVTSEQDPTKIIKILDFKEELIKDPKTGGTRRKGTLLLMDFKLKRNVTITNLEDAKAGQLSIKLRSTLQGAGDETKEFSDGSKGHLFLLGGKEYRILEIDPVNQALKVEKISENIEDPEQQILRLASSPTPDLQQ